MIKIMFVCHGNICRSTMAEYLMKDIIKKAALADEISVSSSATAPTDTGCPVYPNTAQILKREGIDCSDKRAVLLRREDYDKYDYIIGMDEMNVRDIKEITGGDKDKKISRLLDFTDSPRDIADPWYTRDFEKTYSDISEGLAALTLKLAKETGRSINR